MAVHLANDPDLPGDFCRYQTRVQAWGLAHNAAYRRYFSGRSVLRRECGPGSVFTGRGIDACRVDDSAASLETQKASASWWFCVIQGTAKALPEVQAGHSGEGQRSVEEK